MTTYYIDPTTDASGDGSLANPWDSWADAATWVAGNTYLQKEGTTFAGSIGPLGTGGTVNSRINVGVYSATTGVQIFGVKGAAKVNATGQSFGFNITGARPYVTVDGFEVYGATSANITKTSTGSAPGEAQYCEFRNMVLRGGVANGINLYGKGNKLLDSDIYANAQDGVFAVADDLEIARCHVYGNGTTSSNGDCVQLLNSSNSSIHDCVFDHSESSYKQALIINRDDGLATGGRVVRCIISVADYVAGVTAALKSLYIGQPSVLVEACMVSGGQYGAYLESDTITLRSCVVLVLGSGPVAGIAIRGNTIDVSGNTVVGRDGLAGSIGIDHSSASYTGATIRNNLVVDWLQGIRTGAGPTYSNNAFSGCAIRNSDLAGAEGAAGAGDVTTDPLLTTDYKPTASSPLIGAGTHLGYLRDIERKQRQNPPAIGAYDAATLRTA